VGRLALPEVPPGALLDGLGDGPVALALGESVPALVLPEPLLQRLLRRGGAGVAEHSKLVRPGEQLAEDLAAAALDHGFFLLPLAVDALRERLEEGLALLLPRHGGEARVVEELW